MNAEQSTEPTLPDPAPAGGHPGRQAFLLTAHRNPEQVARLVRRLAHPDVDIFIHVDARVDPRPFAVAGGILHPNPVAVKWGGWDLVAATQRLLEFARSRGHYTHYTHLSGQDYPLLPASRLVEEIRSLDVQLLDMAWSSEYDERAWRWSTFHVTTARPLLRLVHRFRRRFWYRGKTRSLPEGLSFACGSALWTLSGDAVEWLFDYLRCRPDVVRFFRHTAHTSEMFYQIILQASPFRSQLGHHRHLIDWSAKGSHPKTFDRDDFDRIRTSGQWFARKFDAAADSEVLDRIDREMLGIAPGPGEAPSPSALR